MQRLQRLRRRLADSAGWLMIIGGLLLIIIGHSEGWQGF